MSTASSTPEEIAELPNRDLVEQAFRFSQGFQRWTARAAAGSHAYPQLRVLESLYCNGPARMGDLATELGLPARNMTTIADGLESEELVRRAPHRSDRRVTMLEVTPAGKEVLEEAYAPRLRDIAELFEPLGTEEKQSLLSALEKLTAAIESL
jgi:DNA-binding MarR family transcriptional regulator